MATKQCYCTSKGCNGKKLRPNEFSLHFRQDQEMKRKIAKQPHPTSEDGLTRQVFRMALTDRTSTQDSKWGDAIWERDSRNPAQRVLATGSDAVTGPSSHLPENSISESQDKPITSTPPEATSHVRALYDKLLALDYETDQHIDSVTAIIAGSVPTTSDKLLQAEEQWLRDTLHDVYVANPGRDQATNLLREAMIDRVLAQLALIETERKRHEPILMEASAVGDIFDTGEQKYHAYLSVLNKSKFNREIFYSSPSTWQPIACDCHVPRHRPKCFRTPGSTIL
jgi:hypothetical protein